MPFESGREDLQRPPVPRGTVDDRLSIGREPRGRNESTLVGQALEASRGVRPACENAAVDQAQGSSEDERGSRGEEPSPPLEAGGLQRSDPRRSGGLREMVAHAREVAG